MTTAPTASASGPSAKTYLRPPSLPSTAPGPRSRATSRAELEALLARGARRLARGENEGALTCFLAARNAAPEDPAPLVNGAVVLRRVGQLARARSWLEHAYELAPDWPEVRFNLGNLELGAGRPEAALEHMSAAVESAPDWPEAHHGLGLAYRELGRPDRALAAFDRALSLRPGWSAAQHNRAAALQQAGLEDRALAAYEELARSGTDHWESHNNLAFLLLRRGDYRRGFQELEWRFQNGGEPARRVHRPQPLWRGEPLDGRTVLLCEEQGAGDMIQFVRLAADLRVLGGRARVECSPALARLFETCASVDACVGPHEPCPEASFQLPMMSLPRVLGTTLESLSPRVSYLSAVESPDRPLADGLLPRLLPFADRFKIGLVWTGSPLNGVNAARSCEPRLFAPLANDPRVALFSLQFAPPDVIEERLRGLPIHSLAEHLGDFAHTAAVLEHLDLVITVDTSMAHLAGAVGQEAWVLLHEPGADWRWLRGRDDSPWYPSLRLFRQPRPGDWAGAIEAVAEALGERLGGGWESEPES